MKNQSYWKNHYVLESDADEIERNIKVATFSSETKNYELVCFEKGKDAPNILISQGSGGHAYIFAELGYQMHLEGYNVFIMPKHGGYTISELVGRQSDAVRYISSKFGDRIGVFAEGLGGFVTFYLALSHSPIRSMVLQNSPAILTDERFREAVLGGDNAASRRKLFPVLRLLLKLAPKLKLPISLYLNWRALIDTKEDSRSIETLLVSEGYLKDPDFDRWYPVSAVMSLLLTPPPGPIASLTTPTMFMVAKRGFAGAHYVGYLEDLYSRLPPIMKRIVQVDGSVYWMLSHPSEAAGIICEWFSESM